MAAGPRPAAPAGARPGAERPSGLPLPAVLCLALALGALHLGLPRGFALGGEPLGLPVQLGLMAGALAVGAWAAFSGREARVLLGSLAALALLGTAWDPRLPPERLPFHAAAAVLFLLYAELALLHARMVRLAAMPRAHLTQAGRSREVELRATASRIVGSWPAALLLGGVVLAAIVGVQAALLAIAPPALAAGVELRGAFGLGLAAVLVLGGLGIVAARRALLHLRPEGSSEPASPGPASGAEPSPGPALR